MFRFRHLQPKRIWAQFYTQDLHPAHKHLFFCQHHLAAILPSTLLTEAKAGTTLKYPQNISLYKNIVLSNSHGHQTPDKFLVAHATPVPGFTSACHNLQPLCPSSSLPPHNSRVSPASAATPSAATHRLQPRAGRAQCRQPGRPPPPCRTVPCLRCFPGCCYQLRLCGAAQPPGQTCGLPEEWG